MREEYYSVLSTPTEADKIGKTQISARYIGHVGLSLVCTSINAVRPTSSTRRPHVNVEVVAFNYCFYHIYDTP